MLTINDEYYSNDYFEEKFTYFEKNNIGTESVKNKKSAVILTARIAVCLEDNALWLALCFYFKKKNISVMPIHSSTPLETAKKLAIKAGCQCLYYHNLHNAIAITVPEKNSVNTTGNVLGNRDEKNDPYEAGLIQMSSGTTGDPKCINRSWHDIDKEIESYISMFDQANTMTPVVACPVTHSYGLISGVLVALARGQRPIIISNINPKYLIRVLQATDKPLLYSSPTMLEGLMRLWPQGAPLHAAMTSGTVMSQLVFNTILPKTTYLFQQYGCSEAGCIAINHHVESPSNMGTPLPHLRVNSSYDSNKPEEIVITLLDNSSNNKTIHTQDLGYINTNSDGDNNLYFTSRLDDTIIVSGLNVYPQDVENVVLNHPHICDAVVFKMHDDFAGQRVCLQYVLSSNDTNISSNDIRNWCRQHLATYQIPQNLSQVESIERMPNGKISRSKLSKYLEEKLLSTKNHLIEKNDLINADITAMKTTKPVLTG